MIGLALNSIVWLAGRAVGRVPMIPGISSLAGGLVPALVAGGTVWLLMTINHWGDVSRVRTEERQACQVRIHEFAEQINDEAQRRIEDALKAADEIKTASTPEEITAACKADRNCREHGK